MIFNIFKRVYTTKMVYKYLQTLIPTIYSLKIIVYQNESLK